MKYVFTFLVVTFLSATLFAKESKIVFWYPGEAGTTEEAQPIIDTFCEYVSEKSGIKLTGKYFNTTQGGFDFVKQQKPSLGILSHRMWLEQKDSIGGKEWLATLPLPHGKSSEQYVLFGSQPTVPANATIYTDETISPSFLRRLFPNLPAQAKHVASKNLFAKLKTLGEKKETAFAVLAPIQEYTLSQLKAPWTTQLQKVQTSIYSERERF